MGFLRAAQGLRGIRGAPRPSVGTFGADRSRTDVGTIPLMLSLILLAACGGGGEAGVPARGVDMKGTVTAEERRGDTRIVLVEEEPRSSCHDRAYVSISDGTRVLRETDEGFETTGPEDVALDVHIEVWASAGGDSCPRRLEAETVVVTRAGGLSG